MTDTAHSPDRIAELLVHVGRAARSEDARADLTAVQWACLRFFARANATTRTPSAFASFQATTRGTASQVIKALEMRGLIARRPSPVDGRSVRFDLTEAGRHLLKSDPLGALSGLLGAMGGVERAAFLATLSRLASGLAEIKNAPAFGTCRDCTHFAGSGGAGYCACMDAALGADEIDMLCASYRGPKGAHRTTRTSDVNTQGQTP
ncbi:MarR family transcriptional regulator [Roseovarius sp. LXJ103]|uniref:MarR family transcriptional regulator n=1 Tax=Roseovarius carneus TaxID=2853164 RepID=UPI000D603C3F|nr:MarR family transcriptional regulator [Roseovarius carneus]MBZ8119437.1 MarR family transcriptional regulator [Roseovarius carneus]PWE34926.1 MarR family transcriptional regulator [Pelagicola sp. LXJ1103]